MSTVKLIFEDGDEEVFDLVTSIVVTADAYLITYLHPSIGVRTFISTAGPKLKRMEMIG